MVHTSLTAFEMQLVTDAQMLVTKNTIIEKVYELFGNLAEEYSKEIINKLPENIHIVNPKISRGENYLGLPYVMLDFPRQFGKTDVFAIRSFFWWGNFFSLTLQLSGKYYRQLAINIEKAINKGYFADWYINTTENQWEHHFNDGNYISLAQKNNLNLSGQSSLKVAKKIPLQKWEDSGTFFAAGFAFLIQILAAKHQCGETGLLSGTPTTGFDL